MASDHCVTVNQRMRRLGLSICALCSEMERRGRPVRYCEVSAAFHGESPWNQEAVADILRTLDELEGENDGKRGR